MGYVARERNLWNSVDEGGDDGSRAYRRVQWRKTIDNDWDRPGDREGGEDDRKLEGNGLTTAGECCTNFATEFETDDVCSIYSYIPNPEPAGRHWCYRAKSLNPLLPYNVQLGILF